MFIAKRFLLNKSLAFFLLLLPGFSSAQDEEADTLKNWQAEIFATMDFYPFPFNDVNNFNVDWPFNYSGGFGMMGKIGENTYFGGNLYFANKDHELNRSCSDCPPTLIAENINTILRYVEIGAHAKKYFIYGDGANIYTKAGLLVGIKNRASSTVINETGDTLSALNIGYANLMYGFSLAPGIEAQINSEWSFMIEPIMRFYLTDLSADKRINFTSFGFLLGTVYRFD